MVYFTYDEEVLLAKIFLAVYRRQKPYEIIADALDLSDEAMDGLKHKVSGLLDAIEAAPGAPVKEQFIVDPMRYEGRGYDFRLVAERTGDPGLYDEMAVVIERVSDGAAAADVCFIIDRESGEPCILITSDGDGMGDHAIRVFPMRPKQNMVKEE